MKKITCFLASTLIGLAAAISSVAQADDLDIYTNPTINEEAPPMTILVLDLNLLDVCANVITNPGDSDYCLSLQQNKTVSELIGGDSGALGILTNALSLSVPGSPTQQDMENVCASYAESNPTESLVAEEVRGPTNECLPGFLTQCNITRKYTFTCGVDGSFSAQQQQIACSGLGCILAGVLAPVTVLLNNLTGSLLNNLVGGLVGGVVDSLLDNVLQTTLDQLPGTLTNVLNTALGGLGTIVADLDNLNNITQLIDGVVGSLANSRLAIVVSHSDRTSGNALLGIPGARASACAFEDEDILDGGQRQNTPNCSNGAYFLAGFLEIGEDGLVDGLLDSVDGLVGLPNGPLANPGSVGQVVSGLLGSVLLNPAQNLTNIGGLVGNVGTTTRNLTATALSDTPPQILPPFQGKEVFLEIMHYLGGYPVYNAPLHEWDVLTRPPLLAGRNRKAANLLGGSIEETINGVVHYKQPPAACRTVNVLTAELSHPRFDHDSDDRLRELLLNLPEGHFTLDDVIRVAEEDGFEDASGNTINLRTLRLIQDLMGGLDNVANVGATLNTVLFEQVGLFGEGGSLAKWIKPALDVDASLLTPTLTADISAPNRLLEPAFFGLFRPDPEQRPRWNGNLKRLKYLDGTYLDATNLDAIDDDGRIKPSATTFWGPHALPPGRSSDGRDVTLGGAGSKIGVPGRQNGAGVRKLHFDRWFNGTLNFPELTVETGTSERKEELRVALGADNTAEAQALALYARGYEVGTKAAPLALSNPARRDWLHGAVLHSQPVAIDYGCAGDNCTPDIRVIYGAQDGFFRMVNNSNGSESWGFMPQVVMKQQKILRDNTAASSLPYGVDGSPTVIVQDRSANGGPGDGVINNASHDKVWAYFGLRRSGRALYGMNLTTPDTPSLLWRIATHPADDNGNPNLESNTAIAGLSGSWFAELGHTFSRPQPARLKIDGQDRIVLIFGGGYSLGKDASGLGTDDSRGNALFIIDAESGELLWKAVKGNWNATMPYTPNDRAFRHPLLQDSIPADVHVVDMDGDGYADRLYVPDTGGRLWRVDLPGSDRGKWTATPIASVGRHDTAANASDTTKRANDRRFFHGVDVVPVRGELSYDAVIFASGNRERPLETATEDALYVLRDTRLGNGLPFDQVMTSESDLPGHEDFANLTGSCADAGNTTCADNENLTHGWKIHLTASGEKGLSQPITLNGRVFFSSYVPDSASAGGELRCEPDEGGSRIYAVSLFDSRGGYFNDSAADPTLRTGQRLGVGLPGDLSMAGIGAVRSGTETLEVDMPRFFPIYWRERRGEDERPIPQNAD